MDFIEKINAGRSKNVPLYNLGCLRSSSLEKFRDEYGLLDVSMFEHRNYLVDYIEYEGVQYGLIYTNYNSWCDLFTVNYGHITFFKDNDFEEDSLAIFFSFLKLLFESSYYEKSIFNIVRSTVPGSDRISFSRLYLISNKIKETYSIGTGVSVSCQYIGDDFIKFF